MAVRLAISLFLVAFASRVAEADEPVQSASQLFEQGLELIEQKKYEEAAIAFRTAYELAPNYKVLYNVGEAERLVGHLARALEAYTRYLDEGGDAVDPDRAVYVRETIAELRLEVGAIEVACPIDGAVILIDGRPRGSTPLPGPIATDAGPHEVVVVDQGEELYRDTVEVGGEQTVRIEVAVEEEPVLPPPEPIEPEVEPSASDEPTAGSSVTNEEPERIWTWVAFGAATATGLAAAITGNLALGKAREIDSQCVENACPYELHDDADQARALALTADLLLGATAALAITGTILYFTEGDSTEEPPADLALGVGSGLVVTGRF